MPVYLRVREPDCRCGGWFSPLKTRRFIIVLIPLRMRKPMAPALLFDISDIDLSRDVIDAQAIERIIPHRGNMRLLDGIVYEKQDLTRYVAYHNVREDEFWVDGHIPGRPVFPGVLMIETAAQLCSYMFQVRRPDVDFMGFAGVDDVRFRGQVTPGDRFVLLSEEIEFRRRRAICRTQGIVDGSLVFEGTIRGMPI